MNRVGDYLKNNGTKRITNNAIKKESNSCMDGLESMLV